MEQRWVTGASPARLDTLLGLEDFGGQDWELECADINRIHEFLNLYERESLNDDERFALMALIVASFDDWLSDGRKDDLLVARIRSHLLTDFDLHESTIRYWSLPDESEPDEGFSITPFIRETIALHG